MFSVGDFVMTWFNTGGKGHVSQLYGKVVAAGPKTFTVVWESGSRNRCWQAEPQVTKVGQDALDYKALKRLGETLQ